MTAVTVSEAFDNTLTNEGMHRVDYLQGGPGWTFTPSNSSGKTIRVLSCYSNTGTSVIAVVSAGVITFQGLALDVGDFFTIQYTVT